MLFTSPGAVEITTCSSLACLCVKTALMLQPNRIYIRFVSNVVFISGAVSSLSVQVLDIVNLHSF